MNIRQIQESRQLYGIENWGGGYFSINDEGRVVAHPTLDEHISVDLPALINKLNSLQIETPVILRFPQIIECQMQKVNQAFRDAIWNNNYKGKLNGVFPFKVNQRREFIDNIVRCGAKQNYGLEVGSKTELIAAMGYEMAEEALLVCNGFKDKEFIELGFIAAEMGKRVILVVEGPDELQLVIDESYKRKVAPEIGIRVKLYSGGSGKWAKSSGEGSKFGLSTVEVLHCLDKLEPTPLKDKFSMLHFHIGSQVTEIKRIKTAIKEASRVYSKVYKMGFRPRYLNIGGGIGVDYDGSKTSFGSSANYSVQEFANSVVYEIDEVCKNENVPVPDIVSESGRVIAAYHSVVVTNIREIQGSEQHLEPLDSLGVNLEEPTAHKGLLELKFILENINRKNYVEYYHDAIEYYEEMFTLFSLGYVNLRERALAEQLFYRICNRALYCSSYEKDELEEFQLLQQKMVSKYFANFSIFQSMPDAWAIDHLFPVMPLSHHERKPTLKATIVDITCDSDGCLERFVDREDVKSILDLHSPEGEPYYLGFFLVGAYQESLANEHNLFGAINEAEVLIDEEGKWEINKITKGDPIDELLICRNYNIEQMQETFKKQLERSSENGRLTPEEAQHRFAKLQKSLESLPYLSEAKD
jgi:arginine decarboxylase